MKTDLDKIKDKYGEKFMHLCRSFFPTLIEKGVLYDTITSLFEPSRDLYDDLVKQAKEDDFKNLVYSKSVSFEHKQRRRAGGSPFELMRKAGYTLYKCETAEDVMSFRKYWDDIEPLCTFRDPESRLEYCDVFFAVKDGATVDGIDGKKRSSFTDPMRQDEYGTSVISIQFIKHRPNTVSIKNRYNHTVLDPDATFSNDLENIQAGLTDAFADEFDYDFTPVPKGFELAGYAMGNDGKFYKYNLECGAEYFCPNNVYISYQGTKHYDKSRYELVDYFLIDKVEKTVVDLTGREDAFCDALTNFKKLEIRNVEGGREFIVTNQNDEVAKIMVDKSNRIIAYDNLQITQVRGGFLSDCMALKSLNLPNLHMAGDRFLWWNKALEEANFPNLEEVGDNFMVSNQCLKSISLPKLRRVGDYFLRHNNNITAIDFPNLEDVGDHFISDNKKIVKVNLPKVEYVGDCFLENNQSLTEIYFPNLLKTGEHFMGRNGLSVRRVDLPKLEVAGHYFLSENASIEEVNLPEMDYAGKNFLASNTALKSISLPKLETAETGFLERDIELESLDLPELVDVEDYFLCFNEGLTSLNLPKLESVGKGFLARNKAISHVNLPKLRYVGDEFFWHNTALTSLNLPELRRADSSFLYSNCAITELYFPELWEVAWNFMAENTSLQKIDAPKLERAGRGFLYDNFALKSINLPKLSEYSEDTLPNSVTDYLQKRDETKKIKKK